MPKGEGWEPEGILRRCTDSSPAYLTTSESSFRELDDEFLQAQTRIWLGELLHLRFDVETSLPELLSDGDLLFQVSWVIWKLLVVTYPEIKYLKAYKNVFRPIVYGKIGSRYLPYSNVDAFLKVCQILGLTAVDLFTPSDVVEKRDVRRVCMCIRALSKRAGCKSLNVPDFDMVTYTIAMPTYVVGCIRKYWEQSRCSTTISTSSSSSTSSRRYQKRTSDAIHAQQGDLSLEDSDDTEISVRAFECESPSSDMSYEPISPLDPNEEISAVTTLDDLSSFLAQNMDLSSGKQSKEEHDYDSSCSLDVSSTGSVSGKICHKSSTFDDTQYSEYADDADSCCLQSGCRSTCLDVTGFLKSDPEDKAHVTSSSSCIVQESSDETCSSANYSEPCSSEVVQDFTDHVHTFHKHPTVGQNHVQELFSEPGELQDVVISNGTSSIKHMISRYMALAPSKETIMRKNTISQAELELNSFEEPSSTYPTADSQLSFDILEKDEPKGASLATPEEPTGGVSEKLTEDVYHSLVKDVQDIRNTNCTSLYFIDIIGDKNLDVSAVDSLSNSVEEDMTEESTLDIESNLQIRSWDVNINNCCQDPLRKAGRPVICSSGEQGTSIEEKAKTEIVVFNSVVLEDSFHVTDINKIESSLMTDSNLIPECKKIQVNCPSSFLKPVPVLVGARSTLVLESSCSSSFCHQSDGGKGCFPTLDFGELEAMAELDGLQLDHLMGNDNCSKCTSQSEIATVKAEEFHNQHKVDTEQLPEIRKSKNDKDISCLGMEEGSENHEMLSVEIHRSGSERNAEDAAKCRPSRKKHLITVAGGVMFVGAFMFLFQLGRKRTSWYRTCNKLRGASQTAKPSWMHSIKHSLLMWSLGLNFY
ncbi:uncharacterized protein LOC116259469 isoform X2 [Nymphaea colorata]|uniref:uncharacterized protein LOC116259469 isoform X2 n=1 Tax=Nymphaea colorata TaxID=210225 RepID=UPI00129E5C0E|nr:uncharacterized protein LOC116259469 isoform X2 [Nymphaea colorata]XP_031493163.1 uncharacterized protein LOC116259469 isoform X2 [Nymphaea colorata]XP_031493164.1 uncharacterized protein LOC116259469 isoform X2 [Nymphaea colorata]XP_031493165.1 uncharacterized protein LOC116259469 isoform X2 [Nymphaea colorata]XP_031493166.1 uncharacterized protein LOC116259469 isoform X2 [Nymphaea colorata]XP_049934957.1 uncharacterized protein LOC116259469 isoform X2 [Nymphaea colorata]